MDLDEWDPNCTASLYHINAKDNILSCVDDTQDGLAFMRKIIDNQGKHHWKFQIIDGDSLMIGIFKQSVIEKEGIDSILGSFLTKIPYSTYVIDVLGSCIMEHDRVLWFGGHYGSDCRKNDILEMYLDFDKLSLSYSVNGKDIGPAFENIDNCKYRVVVWIYSKDTAIKFIP